MNKSDKYLLMLWLVLNLVVGLIIVRDFGMSHDEPDYHVYAANTVEAYWSFFRLAHVPVFGPHDLPNYGPAFIVYPEIAVRALRAVLPNIAAVDVWHFSYFALFQIGGLCLYSLARRWFVAWTAWGILILYTFQPLLWGHAFINPKDIPFMVFSLLTLWSGFRLADSLGSQNTEVSLRSPHIGLPSLPRFYFKESFPFLRYAPLILAGTLLGMTMSIRLLGPLPGLVIVLYLAFTLEQKPLPVIVAYLICAAAVSFLTWPYLWPNPIDHWLDSLVLMVDFPWPGYVLFNGRFLRPEALPWTYLPTLLNIQLTEPLLLLFYLGLAGFIAALMRNRLKLDAFLVITVAGLLPLAALILLRATMYDNFRQILFLLPPLILLTGFALERIFSLLKPAWLRLFVLLLLAFPGVQAMIQLHPYSYVYYNSLAGGVTGAFRRFEMDYWATSYREAALWLNRNAPSNALVVGSGPVELLSVYLRPDLRLQPRRESGNTYDYFVAGSRYNEDLTLVPEAGLIHAIERRGAVLAVIRVAVP